MASVEPRSDSVLDEYRQDRREDPGIGDELPVEEEGEKNEPLQNFFKLTSLKGDEIKKAKNFNLKKRGENK